MRGIGCAGKGGADAGGADEGGVARGGVGTGAGSVGNFVLPTLSGKMGILGTGSSMEMTSAGIDGCGVSSEAFWESRLSYTVCALCDLVVVVAITTLVTSMVASS
jgi:hypothetical protein